VKLTKKEEFFNTLQNQVLPLAKKQPGFCGSDGLGFGRAAKGQAPFAVDTAGQEG